MFSPEHLKSLEKSISSSWLIESNIRDANNTERNIPSIQNFNQRSFPKSTDPSPKNYMDNQKERSEQESVQDHKAQPTGRF